MFSRFCLTLTLVSAVAGAAELKGGAELVILNADSLMKEGGLLAHKEDEVFKIPELKRVKLTHLWLTRDDEKQPQTLYLQTGDSDTAPATRDFPAHTWGQVQIPKERLFGSPEIYDTLEYLAGVGLLKEVSLGFVGGREAYFYSAKLRYHEGNEEKSLDLSYEMLRVVRYQDRDGNYSVNLSVAGNLFSEAIHREILASAMRAGKRLNLEVQDGADVRHELYISQSSLEKLQALGSEAEIVAALKRDDGVTVTYTLVTLTQVDNAVAPAEEK